MAESTDRSGRKRADANMTQTTLTDDDNGPLIFLVAIIGIPWVIGVSALIWAAVWSIQHTR
jgi:hypothetical protein